jgi:uncharacterized protein YegP (UPF0339 family)
MSKLLRCLALVVAMGAISATAISVADAQGKGKSTGIVEVNEGKDGKFRLIVRDANNKYLATSAAFASKEDAMKGLSRLKEVLQHPTITDKKSKGKGKTKEKAKESSSSKS